MKANQCTFFKQIDIVQFLNFLEQSTRVSLFFDLVLLSYKLVLLLKKDFYFLFTLVVVVKEQSLDIQVQIGKHSNNVPAEEEEEEVSIAEQELPGIG